MQFTIAGTIVTNYSVNWNVADGDFVQWYAQIEDDYGNVIGTAPANWVSAGPVDISLATANLQPGSATDPLQLEIDTDTYSGAVASGGSGIVNRFLGPLTYTNETSDDATIEVNISATRSVTWPSTATSTPVYEINTVAAVYDATAGPSGGLPGIQLPIPSSYVMSATDAAAQSPKGTFTFNESYAFAVTIPSGSTYAIQPQIEAVSTVTAASTITITTTNLVLRLAVIKR